MKNYICVNAKYYKSTRASKIEAHNKRLSSIDYLLKKSDYKNITDTNLIEKFNEYYNKQKSIQAKRKCYTRKNGNSIIEMVVALSEHQALHYLNQANGEKLIFKGLQQFQRDLEKTYGFKGLQISLHTDEGYVDVENKTKYNIHAHLTFLNFDFENEKTVLGYLKIKDWQDMQDLAAKSFQSVGLDFIRGKKKEVATKDHLERNEYILKKQHLQLKELNTQLDSITSEITLKNTKLETLKQGVKDLKVKREETKSLDIAIEDKKKIYSSISSEQSELREQQKVLRDEIKELESKKKEHSTTITNISKQIISDTNKIINYSTDSGIFSDSIDSNKLAPAIQKTLKKYSNYTFIAKTEKENLELKQQLNTTIKQKDEVIANKDTTIENLQQENQSFFSQIKSFGFYKTKIKEAVDDLKTKLIQYKNKIKEQTKLIANYETIFQKHNIDIDTELKSLKKQKSKEFSPDF